MKKITINSKDYNIDKVIDFNAICELEELGLSLSDLKKTKMTSIRALLAYVGGMDTDTAGAEIMEHLKKGGSFEDFTPLIDSLVESDFFQATRQPNTAEETPKGEETAQQ
jgi:hypothetical protein